MHHIVFAAEATAASLSITFAMMITSNGIRGPVFEIKVKDPVGRFLIRNAQAAFVIGYSTVFASTIAITLGLL